MTNRIGLYSVLFVFSSSAIAGNYATCLIDTMAGIQNDAAVYAARKICNEEYPGGYSNISKGSGRGLFSFKSGAECTVKKTANTPNRNAGMAIGAACRYLYDEPAADGFKFN